MTESAQQPLFISPEQSNNTDHEADNSPDSTKRILLLERFPPQQVNRSLQAWDAADEYLLNYVTEQDLLTEKPHVLVMNDNFGALANHLADVDTELNISQVSDSYLSQQGTLHNFANNQLSTENLTQLTSLDDIPSDCQLVLYKIPKSKALLIEQLVKIKQTLPPEIVFIAAARAKDIHSATLKVFEQYLGSTKTSLAVKKARLVFSQLDNKSSNSTAMPEPLTWPLEGTSFTISNLANVFAREQLDIGARFLRQHLPAKLDNKKVVDLGCGNGVIGLSILAKFPEASVSFFDESFMAVASAKANIERNLPEQLEQCQFNADDCLSQCDSNSADVIVCNPPFHQQQATTDHIAWQMFNDSFRVLKKGGELRIIGNRQLGYHIKLKRIFGNAKLIASNKKFVVLSAIKKSY
ncbi:methyltransferase [Endozoicomonas sp. G2_1]|uniref:methyltransferase n=1 Tax=Endozoicomonas sp. G2_1 TaxID=2821091 RepID=UPI001ADAC8EB|nr:methyltransferase [Endozoicomonas sp. G2_1]MBO9489435.1 methyltransferase [Endozoicomonas sp. G2_1]